MKRSNLSRYLMVLATVGLFAGLVCAQDTTGKGKGKGKAGRGPVNFDDQTVGAVPTGWKVAETGGKGKLAKWEVIKDATAPSAPNVMAVTKTENAGDTFNLLMSEGRAMADLNLQVKVKAISGKTDQGGGPMWRATNPNNYYVARWNPLEDNFRLYCVKAGKRSQLASVDVKVDPKAWHTIRVNHQGDKIVASFDGKQLIDVTDTSLAEAGMIGLWTKGDAATAFDDVTRARQQSAGGDSKAPADQTKASKKKKKANTNP